MRKIKEDFGFPKIIASEITSQSLNMSHINVKFVPRLLTENRKNYQVQVVQDNSEKIRNNPEMLKKKTSLLSVKSKTSKKK